MPWERALWAGVAVDRWRGRGLVCPHTDRYRIRENVEAIRLVELCREVAALAD